MDSKPETTAHILQVRQLLAIVRDALSERARDHDASKLEEPELSMFDEYTPKLKETSYGSPEYAACLRGMGEALRHHYAHNRHHPEHHPRGVDDMDLVDLIEMICDWKAATLRHTDGSIDKSIETNRTRFKLSDQLVSILSNTVKRYFTDPQRP